MRGSRRSAREVGPAVLSFARSGAAFARTRRAEGTIPWVLRAGSPGSKAGSDATARVPRHGRPVARHPHETTAAPGPWSRAGCPVLRPQRGGFRADPGLGCPPRLRARSRAIGRMGAV